MASQLPFIFRASPLPSNFKGTPQMFLDALVARLSAESEVEVAVFVTGSVEPSSNVGPWLKDGTTWYVWDDVTGAYIPQILEQSSLGYIISDTAPDHNVYQFWIETSAGSPRAVKTWFSGAWVDVYANTLSGYLTITAFDSAISAYSTTAQMNAAIAAAVAAATFPSYPAQGVATAQTMAIDATAYKLAFTAAPINPSPSPFDTTNRRYIAPSAGVYQVSVATQFDNSTGTPAGMEVSVLLYKNGSFVGNSMADLDNTPSPNGDRWSPGFSGLVSLAANDYLEIFASATDGVDSGNLTVTVAQFSVNRVSA